MRTITPSEATIPASDFEASATHSSSSMAQSALTMTRAAIARWSGATPVTPARRDVLRVSPQARWLAKAQQDLAAWIEGGGFSQIGDAAHPALLAPLPGPVMYNIAASHKCSSEYKANACCD